MCKTWKPKKKNLTFFSLEQHGKNTNWENPAPQSFSSYHARVLTDPPLHPDHACLGQPPEGPEGKKKKKQGEKRSGKAHTPASRNLSCSECVLGEWAQWQRRGCGAPWLHPRPRDKQSFRHPQIPGSSPPWVRHSIFPQWSACSPGRPLICPAHTRHFD